MRSGDIFGFLLFIVFLGVSFIGKLMKDQRAGQDKRREPRRQQWPGPVAPPGTPGYPRPMTRPVPRQQTQPPQPPTPRRDADDDDEGVSIEGVSVEGPAPGENVQAELARFDQETRRRAKSDLGAYEPRLQQYQYQSQLKRLKTTLHVPEAELGVAGEAPDGLSGLDDPQSVARAFVLAEVLGKPRALRRGIR